MMCSITLKSRLKKISSSTRRMLCFAVMALAVLLPGVGLADPLDTWHWRNPLPQGNPLQGVT
jgi:hypothetical protein